MIDQKVAILTGGSSGQELLFIGTLWFAMVCINVLNSIDFPYLLVILFFILYSSIIIHLEGDMPENRKQDDLIDPLPYRV
jgi:hypothetical protein